MRKILPVSILAMMVLPIGASLAGDATVTSKSYVDENFVDKASVSSEEANHIIVTNSGSDGATVSDLTIVDGLDNGVIPEGVPTGQTVMDYVDNKPIVASTVNSDSNIIIGDGNGGVTNSDYEIVDDLDNDGVPTSQAVKDYLDNNAIAASTVNSDNNIIIGDGNGGITNSDYEIVDDLANSGVPTSDAVNAGLEAKQDLLTDYVTSVTYNGSTEDFSTLVNWEDGGGKDFPVLNYVNPFGLDLTESSDIQIALRGRNKGGAGLAYFIPTMDVVGTMLESRQPYLTDYVTSVTYNGSTEDFDTLVNWANGGGKSYAVLGSNPFSLDLSDPADLATALNPRNPKPGQTAGAGLGGMIPTLVHVAEIVSVKQNKIPATASNLTYDTTNRPYAVGSVVETTDTAGVITQRGIASAPQYKPTGALVNGDWIPTMGAVITALNARVPTGTANTLANYDANGALGTGIATYDGSTTYNATNDAAKIATAAFVATKANKMTCAGWPDGAAHTDANCWLWTIND